MPDNYDRLLNLETKVAYQDKHIAELDTVVTELNQTNGDLVKRVAALERLFTAEFGSREVANEKPPHY
jgi:uncharacterized coiled-coil protein SlyX